MLNVFLAVASEPIIPKPPNNDLSKQSLITTSVGVPYAVHPSTSVNFYPKKLASTNTKLSNL